MAQPEAAPVVPAPTVGRIVHFTLGNGETRPAIVVSVEPLKADDPETPRANLRVFLDADDTPPPPEEYGEGRPVVRVMGAAQAALSPLEAVSIDPQRRLSRVCRPDGLATYVAYDANGAPGTWRWPPRSP